MPAEENHSSPGLLPARRTDLELGRHVMPTWRTGHKHYYSRLAPAVELELETSRSIMSDESRIRVLSFNCWGLKFVAKNLEQRIEAIAHELATSSYDIIALQELWVFAHYERIRQRVSGKLPHGKFFYSGALGAGLALFSRYPVLESGMHPYSLNGQPVDVTGGDWIVGKGAAHIVILHPTLGQVQIFNTHLFAKGGQPHQLVNAWEFARLARTAAELGRYVICLGDFNAIPNELPISIIREHAGLTDSWGIIHPNVDASVVTDPLQAVQQLGLTADSPLNTWSASKSHARGTLGKRLDYVFYRQPKQPSQGIPFIRVTDIKAVFTEHVPGQNYSFSDHFGLEATLEVVVEPSHQSSPSSEISDATSTAVVQTLSNCYRDSRTRSSKELAVFGVSLFVILAVAIGTAWLPHPWINPIFILFTTVLSWLATTMLYEGFIYGNWERNALMNVIEDLEIYKKGRELLRS